MGIWSFLSNVVSRFDEKEFGTSLEIADTAVENGRFNPTRPSSRVFSALASQDFLRQVYSRRFTKRGVAKGRRRGRILKSSSLKMSLQMASSEQNGRLAV